MYTSRQIKNEAGNKVSRQMECGTRQKVKFEDERVKTIIHNKIIQGKWQWWLSGTKRGFSGTNSKSNIWKYFACDDYQNHRAWLPESKCPYKRPFHLSYMDGVFNHVTHSLRDNSTPQDKIEIDKILKQAPLDFRSEYADINKAPSGPIRQTLDDSKSDDSKSDYKQEPSSKSKLKIVFRRSI